jgi:glycosyltransferase involved in cell wall biosynthesis
LYSNVFIVASYKNYFLAHFHLKDKIVSVFFLISFENFSPVPSVMIIMVNPTLKRQTSPEKDIYYTVIIPAFNEESFLPETLKSLHRAMKTIRHQGEIIVVDNDSTDKTAEIAKKYGAAVVFEPFRQIARTRNTGAAAAHASFLVFLDADTILSPALLNEALARLESGTCCGGGTLLNFDAQLPFLAGRLAEFWNWLSKTNKLAAGSFIFCLSRGFFEIGGFDEKAFAGEEVFFSRRMRNWGKKHNLLFTIVTEHPVITSSRKFQWYSSLQIALLLLFFTFCPFALRSRSLCRFWYSRPQK